MIKKLDDGAEISLAAASDREELLDFLFRVFSRNAPNHKRFEVLYPDLFITSDDRISDHLLVRKDGKIVACVGAYPMTVRIAGCDIPGAGVGQVATDYDYTGRGYMSQLFKAQNAILKEKGVAMAWLGGRRDRYSRFGFEFAGWSFRYSHDVKTMRGIERSRKIARHPFGEFDALTPELYDMLFTSSPSFVAESRERLIERFSRNSYEVWTATPAGSTKPDSWALISGPSNTMALCAGSDDGVLEIIAAGCDEFGEIYTAMPHNAPINDLLRQHCIFIGTSLNTIHVIDPDAVIDAYAPYTHAFDDLKGKSFKPGEFERIAFGPEPNGRNVFLPFYMPGIYFV